MSLSAFWLLWSSWLSWSLLQYVSYGNPTYLHTGIGHFDHLLVVLLQCHNKALQLLPHSIIPLRQRDDVRADIGRLALPPDRILEQVTDAGFLRLDHCRYRTAAL